MTQIYSNGSKWAGDSPESIEVLLAVLATNKLDQRRFEGGFISVDANGVSFFGNFEDVSHVFRIDSTDHEVIQLLVAAIARNVMAHRDYFKPNRFRAYYQHWRGFETYSTFASLAEMNSFEPWQGLVTRTTIDPAFGFCND